MPARKGTRPPNAGKGRKAGSQNKVTKAFKEGVLAAYHGMGGVEALTNWARENQTEFYKIASRLIPHEVTGPDGESIAPAGGYVFIIKARE